MNTVLKKLTVILLLTLGAAYTFANPGGHWESPEAPSARFVQQVFTDSDVQRIEQQANRQNTRIRLRESLYETGDYEVARGNGMNGASDSPKKQGKLSPEDRRTLRRQIDEASHDIYTQKR
ncbi:hypothetical protein [Noviherbaspirillum massiliense]|uniref:hypothetical protein n=1 Tax=Noviherbaspirillum massiliense TaxID=1465823 RepID=UPI00035C5083|nr:hypothetical protein [Noviherbaspirillum massiliense]